MTQAIKLFFPILIFFFLLDLAWLGLVAKDLYSDTIGGLLRKNESGLAPNWFAVAAVYIIFTIGILVFVLPKANGDYRLALLWGALLGFVIYGVYDFTNYSLFANWPLKITLIDLVWGTILCSASSIFAVFMQKIIS